MFYNSKMIKKNLKKFEKILVDGFKYEVPNFLIYKKIPNELTKTLIKKSLIFTRNIF